MSGTFGGGISNHGNPTLVRSTLSSNSADTNYDGGGLTTDNDATATVVNSTFSGNTAGFGGGIAIAGAATMCNVAAPGNRARQGSGLNASGGPLDIGNTLLAGNTMPMLGPLAHNGGVATLPAAPPPIPPMPTPLPAPVRRTG